jgi:TolB-like protein/Flp pilus assembly protein TadD/class 3 adenylate cyclase
MILMPSEHSSDVKFEIGHVLFIDIVGYSKLLITEQSEQLQTLKEIVRSTEQFRIAEAEGKLLRLPTGDGGALVFRNSPEAPVLCALEISKELKRHPELRVRMGIHSGPVNEITDLNEQANIAGAGINIAQRVMDCGDPGHILLSKRVADDLEQYPQWRSLLHELGECEIKHGQKISVVNLHDNQFGNSQTPGKFERAQEPKTAAAAASRPPRKKLLTAAAMLFAIGAAIVLLYFARNSSRTSPSELPAKSIAVLPFVNMSADKNDEYLSDGVSEELITALSKITGLQVKARTSSFAFKGKNEDIQKIGELLHVSHLLEGSVAKAGNKLRITAQLIQASDGNHLWSDTYDREMQDIFAVRSEVAQKVAAVLKIRLLGEEKKRIDKKPTENLEAYNLYRQGRYYADKLSEDGTKRAVPFFQQAIEKDPRFALPYAGIADNYVLIADVYIAPREAFSKAKEAALKAIELDDSLAEAHASLGFVHYHYDWDWAAAEIEFKRAISLNPQSAQSYTLYTHYLAGMGRFDEANNQGRRALELDPLSVSTHWFLGWGAILAGRGDEAISQFSKAAELDPNNPWVRAFLGRAYLFDGMPQRGIEEMETAERLNPNDSYVLGYLGYGYAVTGRRADALKILQRLDEMEKRRYVSRIARVYVYAGLGDKDKAFEWLEKAYQERSDSLAWFRFDPESKNLRSDPRFAALMRKIGFTEP